MPYAAAAVRLQLHALAYDLANFVRTLALPKAIESWSLTSLRERLIKTGARLMRHGRDAVVQGIIDRISPKAAPSVGSAYGRGL